MLRSFFASKRFMKAALRLLEDDVFILIANIKCVGQRYEITDYPRIAITRFLLFIIVNLLNLNKGTVYLINDNKITKFTNL